LLGGENSLYNTDYHAIKVIRDAFDTGSYFILQLSFSDKGINSLLRNKFGKAIKWSFVEIKCDPEQLPTSLKTALEKLESAHTYNLNHSELVLKIPDVFLLEFPMTWLTDSNLWLLKTIEVNDWKQFILNNQFLNCE